MPRCCARRGQGCGEGVRPRRIRRFIEPALLLLLHCRPSHGYALVEGLADLGLEAYPADASTVYRILNDLEANGMLASRQEAEETAGPPRRVYALTADGDAYLQAWVDELRETDRILHYFLDAYDTHRQSHEADALGPDDAPAREDPLNPGSATQDTPLIATSDPHGGK